jgi:hypothetical protein
VVRLVELEAHQVEALVFVVVAVVVRDGRVHQQAVLEELEPLLYNMFIHERHHRH